MNKEKLWSKNFVLAILANMFTGFVFYLLMTTLAMYASDEYGAPASLAGLTASIYVLGSLISRIFTGRYIELIGRRRSLYIGAVLFFLVSLLYLVPLGLGFLLIVRLIHGATFGIINTAIPTIVISYIPENRRGEGVGFFTVSTTLSTALGPFIGVYVMTHHDFSVMFIICAGAALCCLLLLLMMKVKELPDAVRREAIISIEGFKPSSFFEKTTVPIAATITIMGICYAAVTSFITSYATELNLASVISIYFIVYAVVIFLGRPVTGKILDKFGDNVAMIPAIISASVSLAVIAYARSLTMFLIAAVLMAFGLGTVISSGQAITVNLAPKERISMATSTYLVFSDIGLGVGPVLMGFLIPPFGYSGMFLTASGIVFFDLFFYIIVHGRKVRKLKRD